jgi:hypothetical protein
VALGTDARSALQMLWTTWGQLSHLHLLPQRSNDPAQSRAAADRWFNRSSLTNELRLLGACGKERTGFPQASAAQPSEIPHPVDPEIWKRYYNVMLDVSYANN